MKIIDGLKLKGKKVEIPGCIRDDLPGFFKDMGFKVGVEIGVYKGAFTKRLALAGLKVYGIDPWIRYDDYHMYRKNIQSRFDFLYNHAIRYLANLKNCKIIRKTSMEALEDFRDESIDFVYIDGNHKLKYAIEDIHEWSKKVRKGGIISGHDYDIGEAIHVKYAVDAYVDSYKIKKLYILGNKEKRKSEICEKWRSWFWIKE